MSYSISKMLLPNGVGFLLIFFVGLPKDTSVDKNLVHAFFVV